MPNRETSLSLDNLDVVNESMRTFERNDMISFSREERRILQILSRNLEDLYVADPYLEVDTHNNISLEKYISDIESSKTK